MIGTGFLFGVFEGFLDFPLERELWLGGCFSLSLDNRMFVRDEGSFGFEDVEGWGGSEWLESKEDFIYGV